MEPQTNTGQYSIVTLTLLGVVMLILSSAIGAILGPVIFPPVAGTQAEPMQVMQSSSAGVVVGSMDEVHMLSGTVTAIKGDNFTLHTQRTAGDNLADRTVIVTRDTKVIKLSQKDPKVFQSEMADYMKKVESAKKTPQLILPPAQFTSTDVDPSGISIGDAVTVFSDENIDTNPIIVANTIHFRGSDNIPAN